ncbi:p26 [Agrotis segetum nucleopolyhedrovirus B]|uniref:p26 n=1 Tax=Agrotis segetum nucleopolyhedrovirus B TaxID=1580580 RepID=A0A0A7KRG3_9ABAC|nr:p26 [Agrotis segetum nucleopolyhedrovirus B]AIZ48647.1 p26 [Agrotis segetum nucleopolyhedrovirus B]
MSSHMKSVGDKLVVANTLVDTVKSITYSVNHIIRRVSVLSEKNLAVRVHVFGQHDTAADLEDIKYHYPGVASDVKFGKLHRHSFVNVLLFDGNRRPYLRRMRVQDRLYYTHHHYAKYYVYGQVPAVIQKTDISEFMQHLYVSAPIFDDSGKLVSVVTDYYVNDQNQCVLPISGEAGGTQGTLCIDGFVYVTEPEDSLSYRTIQIVSRIDVYVAYDKKNVFINLLYNGVTISKLRIRTLFAANVLIL